MAVHDVDQKILGRLAAEVKYANLGLSNALYQLLGLSVVLTRRLRRARRLRRVDPSRDTKSLDLYHRIIWMSREGLSITELIIPHVETGQYGVYLRIFAAKLRASFYHVFALFHNSPPIMQRPYTPLLNPSQSLFAPVTAQTAGGQKISPPRANQPSGGDQSHLRVRDRTTALRDTIPSMNSETSYVTNPYARDGPISPPPGLVQRSAFILPSVDFLPIASISFKNALDLATSFLPGSSPLRLSIALEHCAFLWDCLHDHEGSRRLASKTIREVYREQAGMDDQEFEDAADIVGTLGRMMRRKSNDPTPRIGAPSPTNPGRTGITTPSPRGKIPSSPPPPAPVPPRAKTPSPPPPMPLPKDEYLAELPAEPLSSHTPPTPVVHIPRKAVGSPPSVRSPAGSDGRSTPSRAIRRKPVPPRKSPPHSHMPTAERLTPSQILAARLTPRSGTPRGPTSPKGGSGGRTKSPAETHKPPTPLLSRRSF